MGSGRDADGRRPESQFVAVCRRVVAQARFFPHRPGERRKSAAVWLLAALSRRPRCEVSWPRLRAGLCYKSARACSKIRHGPARQAWLGVVKKVSHGVSPHRAWLVGGRWSNSGLASAGGRGILFLSPAQKVHNVLAFLPRHLFHNQVFNPIFRPAPDLRPYGEDSRPRWKQRDSEAGVTPLCASWPAYPPTPGAGR